MGFKNNFALVDSATDVTRNTGGLLWSYVPVASVGVHDTAVGVAAMSLEVQNSMSTLSHQQLGYCAM